jgi:ABC-type sugar transport system ATPase subunit/ribose/xylose/arabinose/galactoside ABC-type transport system permease subunit
MLSLLELEGITRRFPGLVALDQVDFDLCSGEIHALVGENGAGKSTLIQIISGVLEPDAGRIYVAGRAARLSNPVGARRQGIAAVHQEADVFGPLSVAENMALASGMPTDLFGRVQWRKIRVRARAGIAGLNEPIDLRRPAALLGLTQRHLIQLAAAIGSGARIMILDEPTAALTQVETAWLFDHLGRLKAEGVGVIYVSHRHEEVFRLADRITVLRDGHRVWTGPATDIDRPGLVRAMVGRDLPEVGPISAKTVGPSRLKTPRLRVRGLTDARGRFVEIDLDAHAGEILGIYGLIGAGRSSMAQALFGMRRLTGGRVEIDGYPYTFSSPRDAVAAGLAYVPEDRLRQGLCPSLSVRANMVLSDPVTTSLGPMALAPVETRITREQVGALGIRLRSLKQPISELSGGNQQKVVLGRWLLTEPKVLLLDEPTRGVDIAAKAEIHRLVRQRAERGCAVVLITSDLPEALAHSDRIAVLRLGRVVGVFDARGTAPELLAEAAVPQSIADSAPLRRRSVRRLKPALRGNTAGLAAALALLGAVLSATTGGRFQTSANLLGIVEGAGTLTILALGSAAVLVAGGIDISVGSLMALAAAAGGLIMGKFTQPEQAVPLGLLAGLATGISGGFLNAWVALAGRIHPIVVTLGTLTIYRGLLIIMTGGHVVDDLPADFRRLATGRLSWIPVHGSVIVMVVATLTIHCWLSYSRSGRYLYAFGANPRAARLFGISRTRVWLTAFPIGGLCAALAGLLELAQNGSIQSGMGSGAELRAITAAVIGGVATSGGRCSIPGVVLGALLLSALQNGFVHWEMSRHHYDLVIGILLLTGILIDRGLRSARS